MKRDIANAPLTEANDAGARKYDRLLEIAKWPEREFVWDTEKWDDAIWADRGSRPADNERDEQDQRAEFAKWDEAIRAEARSRAVHCERDEQDQMTEVAKWDEAIRSETRSHHVHAGRREDGSGNNTAKIVGGITIGLLLIGGGIYAYEMSPIHVPVSHPVALNPPLPRSTTVQRSSNQPVAATPAIAPEATITPAPTASGGNPRPPSSKADSSNGVSPQETLTTDNPINAPMTLKPETAPPPQQSGPADQNQPQPPKSPLRRSRREGTQSAITRGANNSNGRSGLLGAPTADDPIDAPMTLTPETAPPQQQSGPAGQAQPAAQ